MFLGIELRGEEIYVYVTWCGVLIMDRNAEYLPENFALLCDPGLKTRDYE